MTTHSLTPITPHQEVVVAPSNELKTIGAAWSASLRSNATREAYTRWLRHWFTYCALSQLEPIRGVSRVHVDVWQRDLENHYAARSVHQAIAALQSFYAYLASTDVRTDNPVAAVKRPTVARGASGQVWLSDTEVAAFMKACDQAKGPMKLRNRAAVALMYWCGLRVSEVCKMDGKHLGFQEGIRVITIHGKGGKVTDVPIPQQAWERIEPYLASRNWPQGAVFVDRSGKRVTRQTLEAAVNTLAKGLFDLGERRNRVRPHVFRRSAITSLSRKGVPLHRQQDFARHASSDTTRIYDMSRDSLEHYAGHLLTVPVG